MKVFSPVRIKIAAFAAAFAILALPASAFAFYAPANRPTFTWNTPASYITFDSITDNPQAGDERAFLDVRDINSAAVTDKINVSDNQELVVRVFFHNNASANLNLVSTNTRVKVLLPHAASTATYAAGYITSDNANPRVVTDTVDFTGANPFTLEYETGSAQIWTNAMHGVQVNDSVVSNSGALIGYSTLDGNVPGCSQFEGYVTLKVRVHMPSTAPVPTPTPTVTPASTTPTPVKAAATKPAALPNTGAGDVLGVFAGASAAGSAAHYAINRRRR